MTRGEGGWLFLPSAGLSPAILRQLAWRTSPVPPACSGAPGGMFHSAGESGGLGAEPVTVYINTNVVGTQETSVVPDRMIVPVSDPQLVFRPCWSPARYCRSGPRSRSGARSRATKWLRTGGSGRVLTVYFCTIRVGTLGGRCRGPDRGATRGGGSYTLTTTRGRFGRGPSRHPLPPGGDARGRTSATFGGSARAGTAGPPRVR